MKNRNQTGFAVLATLLLVSCGSDSNGVAIAANEVHACDIVSGAEVSRIAEAALVESNVDVERTSGSDAFSQCTHTLEGNRKRVTVQVRTSAAPMAMSKQLDAERQRASDDGSSYAIEFGDAVAAGTDISGIGDVAYTFELHETLYLVVYKDKHLEVRVWMPLRSTSKEQALRIEKEIARAAIDQL
jgi:hypothetical protein